MKRLLLWTLLILLWLGSLTIVSYYSFFYGANFAIEYMIDNFTCKPSVQA